jgi:SET domain-containing protein
MATKRQSYTPGDFALAVRRSSAGLGLFAEQRIPKGACIIEYFGPQITAEQEQKSNSRYLFAINSKKTIDGALRANKARYINHSCKANCEPYISKGRVFIVAKRSIKPEEELAYDYGKDYFEALIKPKGCRCAACAAKPAAAKKTSAVKKAASKKSAAKKSSAKRGAKAL